ncbi:hypothetical protein [Streptomyces aidingensis]|uniref:MYXO-CTERM domain-containing protein n=1 Tax=Streptomyces aidingensis TaxID=910347 RepID=A0A1I1T9T4_9ACTN|nr:hypothetical protein [Streptomyces aidingensis]SFD55359.1 hypothetical protein SAMN05421773_1197 [Streptomyces aidingensis]
MRAPRALAPATLTTAATAAALVLSAGIASAGDFGEAELFPNQARPGDSVAVTTDYCQDDTSATGDATSVGVGTFTLSPTTDSSGLIGQFTVPANTAVGNYGIAVSCATGNRIATATLRVVQTSSTATATTTTSPSGSVSGGVGGSGQDRTALIAGTSAALVAAAAGAVWLIRRRSAGSED